MSDATLPFTIGAIVIVGVIALALLLSRRTKALNQRLLSLAVSFGWEAPRLSWWNGVIRGTWRGYPVQMSHMLRYKGIPERLQLIVKAASPSRLIIKRRTNAFLSKPMTLFGPPLIEPMNLRSRENYWIRSDRMTFAETLLSRGEVEPAIEPNLIAGFDVIDFRPKSLNIMRAIDDRAVKQRFGRPAIHWGRDVELIETIATEEWRLATVLVESAGLRSAGMI